MRTSSPLRFDHWRAIVSLLVLLSLGPFAAAQGQQPAANQKKTAEQNGRASPGQQTQATEQQNASNPPHAIVEGKDFLRAREDWFNSERRLPDGSVGAGMRLKALKHLDAMIGAERKMRLLAPEAAVPLTAGFPGPTTWTSIGPQPINVPATGFPFNGSPFNSGRVAALAVHPTNPDIVFLGAAAGGVWRSMDGGTNWTPLTDNQPSLSTGSVAFDPTNPNVVYIGTGEANNSADSYSGAGVLKSSNALDPNPANVTWTQQGAGVFVGPFTAQRLDGAAHIGAIAVDPTPPAGQQIVLAGAFFFSNPAASGLYSTANGGATWAQVPGMGGVPVTAIVFDPVNPGVVYAALGDPTGATANGVYRSTNHGASWTKLLGAGVNVFPTANVGRIDIDLARSNPTILYAAVHNSITDDLLGVWRTADSGVNWIQQTATPNFCAFPSEQCSYDLTIRVHPADPNTVFAGGSSGASSNVNVLFKTSDGGASWTSVANGANGVGIHVDLHVLAFSANGARLYIGSDGGAWRTDNPTALPAAITYTNLNSTLAITMSYPGHGVNFSDENVMFVGTQDNGTQRFSGPLGWDIVTPGDGAQAALDPRVPSTVYTACQFICIFRSLTDGTSPSSFDFKTFGIVSERSKFIAPLTHDPNIANRVYFGTFRIYLTTDAAELWTPISPDLTGGLGAINAIAVAPSDSNIVYVGAGTRTSTVSPFPSRIWKSVNALSDASATWAEITGVDQLPPRNVTAVAVDRNNSNLVYLTFSGFSGFGADTKGHAFRSVDGGTTWTDISGAGLTALPNVPANDVLADPDLPNVVFVATDVGVFRTADASVATPIWTPYGAGLPRVIVFSLNGRGRSRILRASTKGRGTWIIQDPNFMVPPGPLLSSIRPSSALKGAAAPFALTNIDGANFTPVSKVQFNGTQAGVTTTFVDANHLTASLTDPALLATPGVFNVDVFDPGPPALTSASLRFSVIDTTIPTLASISPPTATVGGPPFSLTVNGSGFNCAAGPAASLVRFGAVSHSPNPGTCTPNQMIVTITASEVATVGLQTVRIFNPPPGAGFSGSFDFLVSGVPPPNDNFLNAININPASLPFTDTQNTSGATTEATDPSPSCAPGSRFHTIWYKFTPTANGTITVSTNGSVLVAVTGGSPGPFTEVPGACASFGFGFGTTVSFAATAGTPYFFMVAGFASSDFGNVVFQLFGNPVPTTFTLSPSSATAGGAAFTLTVNGFSFATTSTVNWNGAPRTTTFVSATQLTAAILASDIAGAGTAFVTVTNPAPGAGTTPAVVFTITSGGGGAPAVTLSATAVAFGNQLLSTTSAAQSVTLTNGGTGTLNISTVALGGANPGDFASAAGTTCTNGATVVPGGSCVIKLTFTPTASGARAANVSITDNALGSPQTVTLTGRGRVRSYDPSRWRVPALAMP